MHESLSKWLTKKDYADREWAISYLEKRGFLFQLPQADHIDKAKQIEFLYEGQPQYLLALRDMKSAYRQIKYKINSDKKPFSTMLSEDSHSKLKDLSKLKKAPISKILEDMIEKETSRATKTDKELLKERKIKNNALAALEVFSALVQTKNYYLGLMKVQSTVQDANFPPDFYEKIHEVIGLCNNEDIGNFKNSGIKINDLISFPPSKEQEINIIYKYKIQPTKILSLKIY